MGQGCFQTSREKVTRSIISRAEHNQSKRDTKVRNELTEGLGSKNEIGRVASFCLGKENGK